MIRAALVRTIAYAPLAATDQEVVLGRGLIHPFDLARLQFKRDDGVSVSGLDVSVRIAGADVDQLALQIECGRRPDRPPRWAVHLCSGGIFLERRRLLLN